MAPDYFMPSEVARLVLGYLQDASCPRAYKIFREECNDLKEHNQQAARRGMDFTKVNGQSLLDILDSYIDLLRKPSSSGVKKTMKVMIDHAEGSPCQPKITITPVSHDARTSYLCQESSSQSLYRCNRRAVHSDMVRQKLCSSVRSPGKRSTGYGSAYSCDKPTDSNISPLQKRSNLSQAGSQVLSANSPELNSNSPGLTSYSPGLSSACASDLPKRSDNACGSEITSYADIRTPFSVPLMSPHTPVEIFSPPARQNIFEDIQDQGGYESDVFSASMQSPGNSSSRTPRLIISTPNLGKNELSQDGQQDDIDAQHTSSYQNDGQQHNDGDGNTNNTDKSCSENFHQENLPQTPVKEPCNLSNDGELNKTPRRKRPPKRKGGGSAASSNNNSNEGQKPSNATLEQEVQQLLNSIEFAEKLAENINLVKNKSGKAPENAYSSNEDQVVNDSAGTTGISTAGSSRQSFGLDPADLHDIDTNFPFRTRQEAKNLADDALRDIIDMTRNDPEFDAIFNILHTDNLPDKDASNISHGTQENPGTTVVSPAKQPGSLPGINSASEDGRTGPGVTAAPISLANNPAFCNVVTVQSQPVYTQSVIAHGNGPQVLQVDSPISRPPKTPEKPMLCDMPTICENSPTVVSSSNETNDSDRYPLIHAVALPEGATVIDLPVSMNNYCGQQLVQIVHPSSSGSQTPFQTVQILSIDPPKRQSSSGASSLLGTTLQPISCSGISTPCFSWNRPILPAALSGNSPSRNYPIALTDFGVTVEKNNNQTKLKLSKSRHNKCSSAKKSNTSKAQTPAKEIPLDTSDTKTTTVKQRRKRFKDADLPKRVTRSSSRAQTEDPVITNAFTTEGLHKCSGSGDSGPSNVQSNIVIRNISPGLQPRLPRLAPKSQTSGGPILLSMPTLFDSVPAAGCTTIASEPETVSVIVQEPTILTQLVAVHQVTPNSQSVVQQPNVVEDTEKVSASNPSTQTFSTIDTEQLSDCIDIPSSIYKESSVNGTDHKKHKHSLKSSKRRSSSKKKKTSNVKCVPSSKKANQENDLTKETMSTRTDLIPVSATQEKATEHFPSHVNGDGLNECVLTSPLNENDLTKETMSTRTDLIPVSATQEKATEHFPSHVNGDGLNECVLTSPLNDGAKVSPVSVQTTSEPHINEELTSVQNRERLQNDESGQDEPSNSEGANEQSRTNGKVSDSQAQKDCAQTEYAVGQSQNHFASSASPEEVTSQSLYNRSHVVNTSFSNEKAKPEGPASHAHVEINNEFERLSQTEPSKISANEKALLTSGGPPCLLSNSEAQPQKDISMSQSDKLDGNDLAKCSPTITNTTQTLNSCHEIVENENSGNVHMQNVVDSNVSGAKSKENCDIETPVHQSQQTVQDTSRHSVNDGLVDIVTNKSGTEVTISAMVHAPLNSPISVCSPAPSNNEQSRESLSGQKKVPRRIRPTLLTREISSSVPSSPADYTAELTTNSKHKDKSVKKRKEKKTEIASSGVIQKNIEPQKSHQGEAAQSPKVQTDDNAIKQESVLSKMPSEQDHLDKSISDVAVPHEVNEQQKQPPHVNLAKSPAVNACQAETKEKSRSPWHEGLSAASPWQFQQPESSQPGSVTTVKSPEPKLPVKDNKETPNVRNCEGHNQKNNKTVKRVNGERPHHKRRNSKETVVKDLHDVKQRDKTSQSVVKSPMFNLGALVQAASLRLEKDKDTPRTDRKFLKRKKSTTSRHKGSKSGSPTSKKPKLEGQVNGNACVSESHHSVKVKTNLSSPQRKKEKFRNADVNDLISKLHSKLQRKT